MDLTKNRTFKNNINNLFKNTKTITCNIEHNNNVAYIILYKGSGKVQDYYRIRNLYYTILLTSKLYNFNIYLTEIGKTKCKLLDALMEKFENLNINYNFITNNKDDRFFDRAHGFNCSIKHFIKNEQIIIMGDCDLPLQSNIKKLITMIEKENYYFISPYKRISKLTDENTMKYCNNEDYISTDIGKLYSITGGILIANRKIFQDLGLWYEYCTYGFEDRALDVIILEKYKNKIFEDDFCYIHLWHPTLKTNFNCYSIPFNGVNYRKQNFHIRCFGCWVWSPHRTSMHSLCKHCPYEVWGEIYNNQQKGLLEKYI